MAKRFLLGYASLVLTCLVGAGCARNSSPPGAEQAAPAPLDQPGSPPEQPAPGPEPAPGASPSAVQAVPAGEVERLITPHLRSGETLAHQVFRGPLGPAPDTALVIVEREGNAAGFVLIPGRDGAERAARRVDLPALSMGLLDSVPAVFFVDADGRPGLEAVIMTRQMTGAGPQGAIPRHINLVVAWNGSEFVRLDQVEDAILDMETAAAIKKTLAASRP
jgi:hypothetical protein